MRIPRTLSLLSVLALAVMTAACTDASISVVQLPSTPQGPVIVDFGLDRTTGSGPFAAIVENPNTDVPLTNVQLEVEGVDDSGRRVSFFPGSIPLILPGSRAAIQGGLGNPIAPVDHVNVRFNWWETQYVSDIDAWVVRNIKLDEEGDWPIITGEVKFDSTVIDVQNSVSLVAVFYDEDDRIMGGARTDLSVVYYDKFVDFEMQVPFNMEGFSRVEMYVNGSYLEWRKSEGLPP